MAGFGFSIQEAADQLDAVLPDEGGHRDWSVDAAIFLGLAYLCLRRMEGRGVTFRLARKLVVFPALKRAWQELIHVRVRLSEEQTREDCKRRITVSKIGRVQHEGKFSSQNLRLCYGDADDPVESRARDVVARYVARIRPHRR